MNLGLKDKTALVTGGSKEQLPRKAPMFSCGRGEEILKENRSEIDKLGGNVHAVQADLTKLLMV